MIPYPDLALELLDRGVDPTLRDETDDEESALELACMGDDAELLDTILKKVGNPTKPNKYGDSLLHIACRAKMPNENIVKRILSLGINADAHGQHGHLPLISAIENSKTEIAILLLDSGARPDKEGGTLRVTQYQITAMHMAIWSQNLNVLARIAETSPNWDIRVRCPLKLERIAPRLETWPFTDVHCLHFAAHSPSTDGLRFLLRQCPKSINCRTAEGQTPMHIAAMVGNIEAAQILVDEGAEVGIQDRHGCTPLHYAVETGKRELVLVLLQGGSPQIADKFGITPELFAFMEQKPEIVEVLREWPTMHGKLGCT